MRNDSKKKKKVIVHSAFWVFTYLTKDPEEVFFYFIQIFLRNLLFVVPQIMLIVQLLVPKKEIHPVNNNICCIYFRHK